MKNARSTLLTLAATALLVPAVLSVGGCASTPGVEEDDVYQIPGGIAVVDTFTTVATVQAVDAAKRRVTLSGMDGKSRSFKAGKDVDLSGLSVGEQIGVRVTEEAAIAIRDDGTPASDAVAVGLGAVTDGQSSGVFETDAVETSAKIAAVDPTTRKVTFQFADGTTRTMKAGKKIDLSDVKPGETVIVQYAMSVAIATSK